MSDQLYEDWWYNSSEGGFYYRGRWYATEEDLNSAGYYKVYTRDLFLGSTHYVLNYQKDLYRMPDGEFLTYDQAHSLGYSIELSLSKVYVKLEDYSILDGYFNTSDGYYIDGNWYSSEIELNNNGYIVGDYTITIYSKDSFTKYDAIFREDLGIRISSDEYPTWLNESDLSSLNLSICPYVDCAWSLESYWSSGERTASHDAYNYNYLSVDKNGNRLEYSDIVSLLGQVDIHSEYDCTCAYVGYYRPWLLEKKFYLERYQSNTVIACLYRPSNDIPDTSYADHIPFALAYSKDVELIKVYSDIGFAYNAFVYTNKIDSTTYYFILDNRHGSWVSDISSEGFYFDKDNSAIELFIRYGYDNTIIPPTYSISKVYTRNIFSFPRDLSVDSNGNFTVYFGSAKEYNDNLNSWCFNPNYETNHASFQLPWVQVHVGNSWSDTEQVIYGYRLTGIGTNPLSDYPNFHYFLNQEAFLKITANNSTIQRALQSGVPTRFLVGNNVGNDLADNYVFELPKTLYKLNTTTNTIEWLGDSDSTSDISFYYKHQWSTTSPRQRWTRAFIKPKNESLKATLYAVREDETQEIKLAIYYPTFGYVVNNQLFETEQDLNLSGLTVLSEAQIMYAYCNPAYVSSTRLVHTYAGVFNKNEVEWATVNNYLYSDIDCTSPILYEQGYSYAVDTERSTLDQNSARNTNSLNNFANCCLKSGSSDKNYRIGLYSIVAGNTVNNNPRYPFRDLSDLRLRLFDCNNYTPSQTYADYQDLILIKYKTPNTEPLINVLAYNKSKDTFKCIKHGDVYKIPSFDDTFRSEDEWLDLDYYVKWDIIQVRGNTVNIRDDYGASGTSVIGKWVGNTPIIVMKNDYGDGEFSDWAHFKFSNDNGNSILDGYAHLAASGCVYYRDSFEVDYNTVILPI